MTKNEMPIEIHIDPLRSLEFSPRLNRCGQTRGSQHHANSLAFSAEVFAAYERAVSAYRKKRKELRLLAISPQIGGGPQ